MTTTGADALLPTPRAEGSDPRGDATGDPASGDPASDSATDPGTAAGAASAARARLTGVDLARGVAVLGMFAAHAAAAPTLLAGDPTTWGGVVHGRSSILFATLAGVSVALMTGRTTPPGDGEVVAARVRVLVRAACLFLLGGLLQLVGTPVAVILEHYAVLLALCVPVLRWRPRRLLLAAAAVALLAPSLRVLLQAAEGSSSWLGYGGQLGALAVEGPYPVLVWAAFVLAGLAVGRCDLGAARVRRALVVGGVALAVLGYGSSWALTQAVPSADPAAVSAGSDLGWDGSSSSSAPGLVPGADVDVSGSTCQRWSEGAVYCAADDGPSAFNPDGTQGDPGLAEEDGGSWRSALSADQFLGAQAHSATTPEVLGAGGVALAVLGACLWLAGALARRRAGWLAAPLVAVGAMPLTAYCVHAVALAVTSHLAWDGLDAQGGGQGGGQEGPPWLAGSWQLWALFAGTALVVCPLWARLAGRGPLERAVSWAAGRATRP